jgi:Cu-Zn family superoxide dismutase
MKTSQTKTSTKKAVRPATYARGMFWPPPEARVNFAVACIKGGPLAPELSGYVYFWDVPGGVQVMAAVSGLPNYRPALDNQSPIGPHGFHLHEFGDCSVGNPLDPFQAAGGHWNPVNQPHGNHAGDFPVLFSNNGRAEMSFFTDRFKVSDIIGKSVIVHQNPDDYRSQPAGNAGKRLGCGIVNIYTGG